MNSTPKTVPNLELFDTSDRSTECNSPSLTNLSNKKKNPRFENMRAHAIGSLILREKSSSVTHGRIGSIQNTSPESDWNRKFSENDKSQEQGAKNKPRSNSNLESFRKTIKGSLFSGFSSPKKSLNLDMSPCSLEEIKVPEDDIEVPNKKFLEEDDLEEIEKNEQPVFKPTFELLSVDDDLPPKKVFEADKSIVDEEEDSESSYEVILDHGAREQIFFADMEKEGEDLKNDLQVDGDPNIHIIRGNFYDYYTEGDILGQGTSGVVKKYVRKDTEDSFAVKIVNYRKDLEMLVLIVREFKNHSKLNHKNIIKVYELYIDYFNAKIYTVMELSDCREMFEVIRGLGHYSEAIASTIFKQILAGINYLHLNGVCHRDLKPHNILVSNDGQVVKITDFNVSKFAENKSKKYSSLAVADYKMWTTTGTIAFTAPEVFTSLEYTEAIDMWSAGIVLYTMLCGYQPFQGDSIPELTEAIKKAEFEFHEDSWNTISTDAKDLISSCINPDPKTRCLPSEALMHPWIANKGRAPNTCICVKVGDNCIDLHQTRPRGESSTFKAKTAFITASFTETLKETSPKRRSSANPSKIPFFRLNSEYRRSGNTSKKSKLEIYLEQEFVETFEEESSPQAKPPIALKE